jgi:hypothetical protein
MHGIMKLAVGLFCKIQTHMMAYRLRSKSRHSTPSGWMGVVSLMGHLNYLQKRAFGIRLGGDHGDFRFGQNESCSNFICTTSPPTSITIQRVAAEKKHGKTKPLCSVKTGK